MPNLKDYPKGFSPYSSNLYCSPQVSIKKKVIHSAEINRWDEFIIPALEEGQFYYINDIDAENGYAEIQIIERITEINNNYAKEFEEYSKKLSIWQKHKDRWDEEAKKEKEDKDYKEYLKLKKKYEK